MVVSPATRGSMMKIDVIRNQLYSSTVGNIMGDKGPGYLGKVYTLEVYMSNNLEAGVAGKKNAVFQREASALILQKDVAMVEQTSLDDNSGGLNKLVAGYNVFGQREIVDLLGNELDGK